ncbi:unnamed protein product [Ceutorhynchus assimilis]|uniref:DUF8207 domain-containing protein n=1 Tax=Ceutorhynchus assimilis TaxID=467358 RepID=A0A9N9QRB4_9CUCU|nr:unnamed protein product [Ceutorhynchus assimilis]
MPPETLSKFDKRIKRKIIAAADNIKRKYTSLKLERNEEDDAITKFFNPIKEPLIKLAEKTNNTNVNIKTEKYAFKNEGLKNEEEEEEDQEGIDFKPKKIRKISKYASTSRPKEEVFEGSPSLPPLPIYSRNGFVLSTIIAQKSENLKSDDDDDDDDGAEDVFYEPLQHLKEDLQKSIHDRSGAYEEFLDQYPKVAQEYVDRYYKQSDEIDHSYGLKHDMKTDDWSMGSQKVNFLPNGDIKVGAVSYKGTQGLYDLLFLKKPIYQTEDDKLQFTDILNRTNVHRRDFDPSKQVKGSTSSKYRQFVKPLVSSSSEAKRLKSNKQIPSSDNNIATKENVVAACNIDLAPNLAHVLERDNGGTRVSVLEPVVLTFTSVNEEANVNESAPLNNNNLPSQDNPKHQLKESVSNILITSPGDIPLAEKTYTLLEPVELAFTTMKNNYEEANVNETVPLRQAEYDLGNSLIVSNLPSQDNRKNSPTPNTEIIGNRNYLASNEIRISSDNLDGICTDNAESLQVQSELNGDRTRDSELVGDEPAYDSDDSVADPTYEPVPINEPVRHHVVADSPSESENNLQEANSYKGRPKKGRKRKFPEQSREEGKKRRNSNLSHFDYKGREKASRRFIDFDCQCKLKCRESVSIEERMQEFEKFWALQSYNCQTNYIAAAVSQVPKKRNYGRNTERRNFSRCYKINDKVVCRELFIKTLGISPCRVNTALKKFHGAAPLTDQRGVNQGGKNKIPEHKVDEIISQIDKIPKYISHYSRKKTDAKFLPPDVTVTKMYEMYTRECQQPVSITKYKQIFYSKFNLRTKELKKDTCNKCDSLKMKIENEKNDEKKRELTEQHKQHLDEAENAQALRREDFRTAKEMDDYECLTFDMEKTLPLPRIPTNIVFYKRQLWIYNTGVHSGKDDRGYCYVWAEGDAGRGAQEVGSCLIKHVQNNLKPEVEHLILWSDSCGGQNRNIKLTLILKYILHSSQHLEDITLKFLCSGHSFLPNDSDFGDIESALKHQQQLYLPADYINVMKLCRKKNPLIVTEMSSKDFLGVTKVEKNITNRKISVDGEKINWLNIRSIKIEKNKPFSLYIQQNTFDGPFEEVNIQKLRRGRQPENQGDLFLDLDLLWPQGKAIAEPKLANLRKEMPILKRTLMASTPKILTLPLKRTKFL